MSAQQVIDYLETMIGRQFSGQRIYSNMDDTFPSSVDSLMASQGGLLYHNINSFYGSGSSKVCRSWADVAAGAFDSWWISQAQKIKAFGYPILLSFNHEPTVDNAIHPSCGTPAEYRAAFDHLVQLFRAQGVTNVKWVWTQTASTFNGHNGGPAAWEPAYYDVVGVDGYARASAWRTPQEIFQTASDWAKLRGKPLLVGEIGVEELAGDPSAKADWIAQAGAMFKSFGNVLAVVWNNDPQYSIDSSPQALAAFAAVGHDPKFGG